MSDINRRRFFAGIDLPTPDGTIDKNDRAQVLGIYPNYDSPSRKILFKSNIIENSKLIRRGLPETSNHIFRYSKVEI